jgi:hypothetical protein
MLFGFALKWENDVEATLDTLRVAKSTITFLGWDLMSNISSLRNAQLINTQQ